MFGRIGVIYDVHENALQIPRSAIIESDGAASVFVVEDGRAQRKSVSTGYGNRGMIEVTGGLAEEERVIVVGQASLKQDSPVTVINQADGEELSAEAAEDDSEELSDAPVD
jgi:membrane fusion protein (multidrug efflux system)